MSDWTERQAFDLSYRRTGKTTQLCQHVAEALQADPELRVIITGAHVLRNEWYYRRLLHDAGVDCDRVRIVAPARIERSVMGFRGKLFCDDFTDLELREMRAVMAAERYLLDG